MSGPTRMARQLTGGNVQEGVVKGDVAILNVCEDDEDELEKEQPVSVCMIGTGEYTTGYVHGGASDSDKGAGGERAETIRGRGVLETCSLKRGPGVSVACRVYQRMILLLLL